MTEQEWLSKVRANQEVLESLIEMWHPVNIKSYGDITITAPGAEAACESVRQSIKAKEADQPAPIQRFRTAIAEGKWEIINQLLNSAWFGVPESRDCWNIKGFSEAVDLMDELPDSAYASSHESE